MPVNGKQLLDVQFGNLEQEIILRTKPLWTSRQRIEAQRVRVIHEAYQRGKH
jgi:hypothetical protein